MCTIRKNETTNDQGRDHAEPGESVICAHRVSLLKRRRQGKETERKKENEEKVKGIRKGRKKEREGERG